MDLLIKFKDILAYLIPVFAGLFIFWSDSKKDGFDQEKVFDLLIAGLLGGAFFGILIPAVISKNITYGLTNPDPYAFLFCFISVLIVFVIKRKWSVYRVLDNVALSLVITLSFWLFFSSLIVRFRVLHLIIGLLLFIVNYLLRVYKGSLLKSGFTFCLVMCVFSLTAMITSVGIISLIFLLLLFTLSGAILFTRLRVLYGRHKINHGSPTNF